MTADRILALDVGTQSVRAMVVDPRGEIPALVQDNPQIIERACDIQAAGCKAFLNGQGLAVIFFSVGQIAAIKTDIPEDAETPSDLETTRSNFRADVATRNDVFLGRFQVTTAPKHQAKIM